MFALIMGAQPGGDTGGGDSPPARWQYIANSAATFDGASGALARTAACEVDYGPGARWCSSREIVESTEAPPVDSIAWARSAGVAVIAPTAYASGGVYDTASGAHVYGLTDPHFMKCDGWSTTNGDFRGLAVEPGGSFRAWGCDNVYPVACCTYR
jgi:hypothetical protein